MAFLGGDQREPIGQVEARLVAKYGKRTCAGAVGLSDSVLKHVAHEFEILAHRNQQKKQEA